MHLVKAKNKKFVPARFLQLPRLSSPTVVVSLLKSFKKVTISSSEKTIQGKDIFLPGKWIYIYSLHIFYNSAVKLFLLTLLAFLLFCLMSKTSLPNSINFTVYFSHGNIYILNSNLYCYFSRSLTVQSQGRTTANIHLLIR